MDYNKIMIIGRLGADPELKTNPKGTQSMIFSLANSIYSKNQETGEMTSRTIWHKITVWGDKLIQKCLTFAKGDTVLVEGYIDYVPIKKEHSQTEATSYIAKVIVSSFKNGFVEQVSKRGTKSAEESVGSTTTSTPKNSFYSNKAFKDKKDFNEDFIEEDGF
jgi:single-strand DNA-binding protein